MIIIVGNIIDIAKDGYIIHQVNCQDVMGKGLAKSLYEKFPIVKVDYHKVATYLTSPDRRFGLLQHVKVNENLIVLNSFSQLYYGNSNITKAVYTDENVLIKNILEASKIAQQEGKQLYVSWKIGCGLAGGNWHKILQAIKKERLKIVILKEEIHQLQDYLNEDETLVMNIVKKGNMS